MSNNYPIKSEICSYIGGQFVQPSLDAFRIEVINPATGKVLCQLVEADKSEVEQAVQAASDSLRKGEWRNAPSAHRAAVFRKLCTLMAEHKEEMGYLESVDLGLPISQANASVVDKVIRNFSFYADALSQLADRAVSLDDMYQRYVRRDPIGVCGLISPWNAPLMLATSKIAPALAFGNSCVIKTSEYTPLAVARFMEILSEAGIPDGVINLVNGRGEVTGDALVKHPDVALVSFTGGGTAGRIIASNAAHDFKKCDLELGGKSANIITESANLDDALEGSLLSIFANTGQMCFAGSRILVHRSIADQFLEKFVARATNIKVGDPLNPETQMGPLCYEAHMKQVLQMCDTAVSEGVEVLCGGKRCYSEEGYFMEPTVLLTDNRDVQVFRDEIFGPVATVYIYDDFSEAIDIANDSNFGLAGYLWTNNLDEMNRVSRNLKAGAIMINSPMVFDLRMPFGGYKESGVGREGIEGLRDLYTEQKSVAIAQKSLSIPLKLGV